MAKLVKDRELSVFMLLKFRDSKYFAIIKKTNTKMDKIADFTKFESSFMARRLEPERRFNHILGFFPRAIVFVP